MNQLLKMPRTKFCTSCDFDPSLVTGDTATLLLYRYLQELTELLSNASNSKQLHRSDGNGWSALEYAGHLRDVLIVQRERILRGRFEVEPTIEFMYRNERVEVGEYRGCTAEDLVLDLRVAARWLLNTLSRFDHATWTRRVVYNYPNVESRDLLWVAAHTIHEVTHHTVDIRERLASSEMGDETNARCPGGT